MKVVIIGGVAGGATCAARIRRLDEKAEIVIFERTGFISYANCGLPYYIGGVIDAKEKLTVQTPQAFMRRFRIDARVRHEVQAVNAEKRTVTVRELDTGRVFEESYDKLLIATGAKPRVTQAMSGNSERVFTLRTVEDTLRIREHIEKSGAESAVIAGGGFIGLEMAENLRHLGKKVTIIQRGSHLLTPLDGDMASMVHAELRKNGVDIILHADVTAFTEKDGKVHTELRHENGEGKGSICSDIVICALGVIPDSHLAKDAGCEINNRGSIVVNEHLETSVPNIYAVGDAIEITNLVSGKKQMMALAGPANKQARIAADNICGIRSVYRGAIGTSVLRLFGTTVCFTGLNETAAKALGFDCESVILAPASHATYFPGASVMTMKVCFDKTSGHILGAQIIGPDGCDKRIDVLAAAIRGNMTALDIAELDLAYAPPYSSAKDPVNMAGFMIDNVISGRLKQFRCQDVSSLPRDGSVVLLDTRTPQEFARGYADGFVNIPVDELRNRISELEHKPIYVMCQSGLRGYIACMILRGYGFDCYNFAGGYRFYASFSQEAALASQSLPCGMDCQ